MSAHIVPEEISFFAGLCSKTSEWYKILRNHQTPHDLLRLLSLVTKPSETIYLPNLREHSVKRPMSDSVLVWKDILRSDVEVSSLQLATIDRILFQLIRETSR